MNKFKAFISNDKNQKFLIPFIAVLSGFLVGVFILLITRENPIDIFRAILRAVFGIDLNKIGTGKAVFNPRYVGEYFVYAMPIILTGLSIAFAFRTGLFNIGSEGQVMVGSFASVLAGIYLDFPVFIHLPLVIISGALAGAIWGFVPGLLKAKFNVHEVVVGIMMNYSALHITNYFLRNLKGSDNVKTAMLPVTATLNSEFLSSITNKSRLHWGFIIVIISVFIFWFIIEKTTFGYELRSVGFNKNASKYAGMKVDRNTVLSMMISGAFSGLAGTIIAIGTFGYGRVLPGFENYGFDGIAVALLGGNTGLGSVFGGLLLGSLKAAQPIMQTMNIPRDIAIIIVSFIILFIAMQNGIKMILKKLGGAK
ncbi:MAG: ABC transporter permease [Firmicutes bacterium HGW-Firmicutes-7]|nr:MAG: ABC transporter permease [Firmicutes bacterium HGW-Firmicutes-7]